MNRKIAAIAAAAVGALVFSAGGAVAGSLVTSAQIKDNSVRSIDVKDGTLRMKDFRPGVQKKIRTHAKDGTNGTPGTPGTPGAPGQPGTPGEDGSVAGVQRNWSPGPGATIVNPSTVTLTNVGTPAGSSVEIQDLNLPVQATKTVVFTYRLTGGAVYGGGSPRVFIQINDTFHNTHDADPSDAGVDNGNGTFTKTWTIPANGTVHAAGIVVDSGVGSIEVSNLKISGHDVKFS